MSKSLVSQDINKANKNRPKLAGYLGGADGTQTHDLYDANVALYQLSYNPKTGADKKTRTSKALLPLVPETSASTNSAISALAFLYMILTLFLLQQEKYLEIKN